MKTSVEPFLRWAGGKRWLVKHLDQIIGDLKYGAYHEPFLGSGAIFFALAPPNKSYLSDLNQELIDTYIALQTNPEAIIEKMKCLKNTKEFYYE
ncbi:MAG: DNA adenine methylase, partial [Oscillospiraceae bacterium]|nr:DNA adenine methylase [Oscillospiraceae bacterium]